MGLIIDSSVIIAAERRRQTVEDLIAEVIFVAGDEDAALSSIALTEVVHGVYRAKTSQQKRNRRMFLDELLRNMFVYPYTEEAAMIAGRIDGEQQSEGVVIPYNDLLIGATALSLGYSVLTLNLRHFRLIPGLVVIPF